MWTCSPPPSLDSAPQTQDLLIKKVNVRSIYLMDGECCIPNLGL